ncbi:MAG: hypothetical protein ACT4OS_05425 [Acidimicrobiales bacterium]
MLEAVINLSEGRDLPLLATLAAAAGDCLIDVHSDPDHHRSVFTLAGAGVEAATMAVAALAADALDLGRHRGAHPRMGVVDVVPFVALAPTTPRMALAARDRFARWFAARGVPCFLYGDLPDTAPTDIAAGAPGSSGGGSPTPMPTLPDIRREAYRTLMPTFGPRAPHPRAGSCCVGARPPLVAYNLWLSPQVSVAQARAAAQSLRGPAVRALALDVGGRLQLSFNLTDPDTFGPADIFDQAGALVPVVAAELVGLIPSSVLAAVPRRRWRQLDLGADRTLEERIQRAQHH